MMKSNYLNLMNRIELIFQMTVMIKINSMNTNYGRLENLKGLEEIKKKGKEHR